MPEAGALEVAVDAEPDEAAVVAGVLLATLRHPVVESEEQEEGQADHHEELRAQAGAQAVADPPAGDDHQVHQMDGQGRDRVAEAGVGEEVVQVRPVGAEGREALGHPPAHHAQAIHDRLCEDGHYQRDEADARVEDAEVGGERRGAQDLDDEAGQERAHHQGAAVAEIDVRFLAEDVVQQEGDGGRGADERQHGPAPGAAGGEDREEEAAGEHAETAAEAVHPVDEVDGVDDAHDGDHRQRVGDHIRDAVDTEQPVEVLDDESVADEQDAQEDLHGEADLRRERDGIVDEADVEHQDGGQQRRQDVGALREAAGEKHRGQDAEADDDAAHHGDGRLLELARIGIVRDVLLLGKLEDEGVRPKGDAKRNHCG